MRNFKEGLGASVNKGGVGKKKKLFDRAYNRFFEGYETYMVTDAKNKKRVKRVYVAEYYQPDLDDSKRIKIKILYCLAFLSACFLFGKGALAPVQSNTVWFVTVAQAFSVVFLFGILVSLINYVFAEKKMKIHEYKTSVGYIRKFSIGGAAVLGVTCLMTLLECVVHRSDIGTKLLCAAAFAAAALLILLIYFAERNIVYIKIDNSEGERLSSMRKSETQCIIKKK